MRAKQARRTEVGEFLNLMLSNQDPSEPVPD
jgi:hypothetical protein